MAAACDRSTLCTMPPSRPCALWCLLALLRVRCCTALHLSLPYSNALGGISERGQTGHIVHDAAGQRDCCVEQLGWQPGSACMYPTALKISCLTAAEGL